MLGLFFSPKASHEGMPLWRTFPGLLSWSCCQLFGILLKTYMCTVSVSKQLYNTDRCISSSSFIFYKVVSPKSHFQWKRQLHQNHQYVHVSHIPSYGIHLIFSQPLHKMLHHRNSPIDSQCLSRDVCWRTWLHTEEASQSAGCRVPREYKYT